MSDFLWTGVSALASVVSASLSGGALVVAAGAYRGQIDERRSRQAARVLFRVIDKEDDDRTIFLIDNRSDLPIFDINIPAVRLALGEDSEIVRDMDSYSQVEAGAAIPLYVLESSARLEGIAYKEYRLEFTDGASSRWVRTAGGKLTKTGSPTDRISWLFRRVRR